MQPKYRGFMASSEDPTGQTLSLTVSSFAKVLVGLVGYFAISKGFDITQAQSQVQAILDLVAQAIPLAFTLFHSLETIFGLLRKLLALFKKSDPVPLGTLGVTVGNSYQNPPQQ